MKKLTQLLAILMICSLCTGLIVQGASTIRTGRSTELSLNDGRYYFTVTATLEAKNGTKNLTNHRETFTSYEVNDPYFNEQYTYTHGAVSVVTYLDHYAFKSNSTITYSNGLTSST